MTLDVALQILISSIWAVAVFSAVATLAGLMTWGERKLASMIQDRIGPNRANIRLGKYNFTFLGLLHIVADPVKLFMKEDFVPEGAHKALHTLAPILCLAVPFIVFSVIPFAAPLHVSWKDFPVEDIWFLGHLAQNDLRLSEIWVIGPLFDKHLVIFGVNVNLLSYLNSSFNLNPFYIFNGDVLHLSNYTIKFVIADLDVGMLFVFAISSLAVYGVILAGWSSNNKFSFLGAMRGANQMISYEVGLGLCAVGIFMIYGGVSLGAIVQAQGELMWGVVPKWGIVTQPFAFLLFMACGMAEIKRVPFDLPESESEIVAGYFTEYSSMKFTMFLFGEYVEMILLGAVVTTLFFGGWQIPFVSAQGVEAGALTGLLIALLQIVKFGLFTVIWVYFIFMIRWTFPRFRYDQLMKMGWKMVLPLALLNIIVTGLGLAYFRGWM